jgi:hypothetical protein
VKSEPVSVHEAQVNEIQKLRKRGAETISLALPGREAAVIVEAI